MKKSIWLIGVLAVLLLVSPVLAVNTITYDDSFISIVLDGSTDWDSSVTFPTGIRVAAIGFYPSAANDVLVIRNKTDSGVVAFKVKDTTGGGSAFYFSPARWKPYIKAADCTLNTAANAVIIIHRQAQTQ